MGYGERDAPTHLLLGSGEKKPYYVDSQSTILINLVAKAVRKAVQAAAGGGASIKITEMLPGPEHCWLTDSCGGHYTSELRMVTVDLRAKDGDLRARAGSSDHSFQNAGR